MRLMPGDELRLRYVGNLRSRWDSVGHVIKVPNSILICMLCAARAYGSSDTGSFAVCGHRLLLGVPHAFYWGGGGGG